MNESGSSDATAPDATAPAASPGGAGTHGWDVASVAEELLRCEAERRDRPPFTDEWDGLDLDTGYQIQDATLQARLARGETLIGVKLGLTSRAKQERMGVHVPLVAWLTDAMVLEPGRPVPQEDLIHPRVEPEIVFVMRERLEGPGVTAATAMAAVDTVLAGAEVIDSRYRDFRFAVGDVVADNASSAVYVTGPVALVPDEIDLVAEEVTVAVDGDVVDSATGAAVLGHPGEALALAANELARRDHAIEAGWVVLTGALTDAVPIPAGTEVDMRFASLGSIHLAGGDG